MWVFNFLLGRKSDVGVFVLCRNGQKNGYILPSKLTITIYRPPRITLLVFSWG